MLSLAIVVSSAEEDGRKVLSPERLASIDGGMNIAALIIEIGLWGVYYSTLSEGAPNSLGNDLGPQIM